MKTKTMVICAMFSALCAILGFISLDSGNIKLTFENLPILLGALMFGPVSGMLIGFTGTLLYQLLRYGISATTLLWVLPYALGGFVAGYVSKKNGFKLKGKKLFAVVIGYELLITVLNTFVIYADSRIYGWYYPALIWGSLAARLIMAVGKAVVFTAMVPVLLTYIRKGLSV